MKEEIINVRELIKTFRRIIEKSPALSIPKVFAYMDSVKDTLPLVLVSKNFTNYFNGTIPKYITEKILKDAVIRLNKKEMNNIVSVMKDVHKDEPKEEASFVKKLKVKRSRYLQPGLN